MRPVVSSARLDRGRNRGELGFIERGSVAVQLGAVGLLLVRRVLLGRR